MLRHKIKIIDAAMLDQPPLPECHWPKAKIKGFLKTIHLLVNNHNIFVYCDVPWYLLPFKSWKLHLPDFYVVVEATDGIVTPFLQIIGDDRYTVDVDMTKAGKNIFADYYYYHIC